MNVYARGKTIPTYSFANLLRQGERFADIINIFIGREYEGRDLSGCSFLMRGINGNNEEAQQVLIPVISGNMLVLGWNVSDSFTAVSGRLELELRVSELSEAEETLILKYEMPPVNVAASPSGENAVIPDTSEQIISEIADAADEGIARIMEAAEEFDIAAVEKRLDAMEAANAEYLARPEVIPVTESEYSTISHKKNALYVIVKE